MVALFEVGAFTTSMQVIRNDEVLYDRDQAFGGAQLTQLIVRQYGFSPEEAETKKRNGDLPEDYASGVLKPFVESMAQEIARALQFFFTSTPHNKVDYVMLAGGSAALPGPDRRRDHADLVPLQPGQSLRGHAGRRRGARKEDATRGAVVPDLLRSGHAEVPAVILINLLPHREAARKRRREAFYRGAGAVGRGRCADRRRHLPLVRGPDLRSAGQERGAATRDQAAGGADQGHRHPAGRDCRPAGAPAGGGRPAGRPQHAGAPAERAGQATARRCLRHQPEAGQPDRVDPGRGPVQRAGFRTAAQPGQQQPLAEQAGTGRNHRRQRRAEPARPAPRLQLHHAGEAAARQRGAESRGGRQRRIRRCRWRFSPAAVASASAKT